MTFAEMYFNVKKSQSYYSKNVKMLIFKNRESIQK